MPLRVDASLALNYDREFVGDWYTSRVPGPVDDHLRVEGLKIHPDDGWGHGSLEKRRPTGSPLEASFATYGVKSKWWHA